MAQLLVYAHCEFARAARRDYAFPLVFSVSNSKALSEHTGSCGKQDSPSGSTSVKSLS
jgi:hypothetical protein